MRKYLIITMIVMIAFTPFVFADAVVVRGNKVVTGDLYVGRTIHNTNLLPKIATILMTGVDYTLSAAEALCDVLLVTGSPSGQAIIAPAVAESGISRIYTVRNGGADSLGLDIMVSGGTGVTVATGKTASVYYNGSDYARQTADATN